MISMILVHAVSGSLSWKTSDQFMDEKWVYAFPRNQPDHNYCQTFRLYGLSPKGWASTLNRTGLWSEVPKFPKVEEEDGRSVRTRSKTWSPLVGSFTILFRPCELTNWCMRRPAASVLRLSSHSSWWTLEVTSEHDRKCAKLIYLGHKVGI